MESYNILLERDEFGYGMNIGSKQQYLYVKSFRRRHGEDIGPAEASNEIHVGDILLGINGIETTTLAQVHAQLKGSQFQTAMFRFLKAGNTPLPPMNAEDPVIPTPDIVTSILIKETITENKYLKTQLEQAKMKIMELQSTVETLQVKIQENSPFGSGFFFRSKSTQQLQQTIDNVKQHTKQVMEEHMQEQIQKLKQEYQQQLDTLQEMHEKQYQMLEMGLQRHPPEEEEQISLRQFHTMVQQHAFPCTDSDCSVCELLQQLKSLEWNPTISQLFQNYYNYKTTYLSTLLASMEPHLQCCNSPNC